MATIKICTMGGAPRFVHDGLIVGSNWADLELDTLTDPQRQALFDYTGKFIRVHDESDDVFRAYLGSHGLEYKERRVVDPRKAEGDAAAAAPRAPAPPRDDTSGRDFQAPPGAGDMTPSDRPSKPRPR